MDANNHIIVGGTKSNYTRYVNHGRSQYRLITSNRWKTARFEAIEDKTGEKSFLTTVFRVVFSESLFGQSLPVERKFINL